jgi:hypothetical protein
MLRVDLVSVTCLHQFLKTELLPSSYGKSLLTGSKVQRISRNDYFYLERT